MNKKDFVERSMKALLLAAAVASLAAAVIVGFLEKKSANDDLTIDPYSGTYVAAEQEEPEGSPSGIAIPGWGSICIKAGETMVDVNLENPIDNKDGYNMSFALYLKGETEALAETGLIRPGESALKLELSHPLDAGEYEATVHVQPYRMADGSATNNAEIETILIAE